MLKRYVGRLERRDNPELALKRGFVDLAVNADGQVLTYSSNTGEVKNVEAAGAAEAVEEITEKLEAEYYNKEQVDELIKKIDTEVFVVVDKLPEYSVDFNENKVYLLPRAESSENNKFDEYKGTKDDAAQKIDWELIGTATIDLSDYYTKAQADAKLSEEVEARKKADEDNLQWVKDQNYLTEHQDLSDYAKTADVETKIQTAKEEAIEVAKYDDSDIKKQIEDVEKTDEDLKKNVEDLQKVDEDLKKADEEAAKRLGELEKKDNVVWTESTGSRKHIVLKNHDSLLGTDTSGSTFNLAMMSKWNVADFGSGKVHMNLNSSDEVTINDKQKIATQNWVEDQKYLKEHQDLSDYAKTQDVESKISTAKDEAIKAAKYDDTEIKKQIEDKQDSFENAEVLAKISDDTLDVIDNNQNNIATIGKLLTGYGEAACSEEVIKEWMDKDPETGEYSDAGKKSLLGAVSALENDVKVKPVILTMVSYSKADVQAGVAEEAGAWIELDRTPFEIRKDIQNGDACPATLVQKTSDASSIISIDTLIEVGGSADYDNSYINLLVPMSEGLGEMFVPIHQSEGEIPVLRIKIMDEDGNLTEDVEFREKLYTNNAEDTVNSIVEPTINKVQEDFDKKLAEKDAEMQQKVAEKEAEIQSLMMVVKALKAAIPDIKSEIVMDEVLTEGVYNYAPENGELYIANSEVGGPKGSSNGKIMFNASKVDISGVKVDNATGAYNIFEQGQTASDIKEIEVKNLDVKADGVIHNVVNAYNLEDGAVITLKDIKLVGVDPNSTNLMRVSNYKNAKDVVINFENIDMTYAEGVDLSDFKYFGFLLYQAVKGKDSSYEGTSCVDTWTVNFKNCYLNGKLVENLGFNTVDQVAYAYNFGGGSSVTSIDDAEKCNMKVNFIND